MRGAGTSVSHPQTRPCSGRKTLKRCRNNGEASNVVFIDIESESFNNVIVIDVPESLPRKFRGSGGLRKDKNCQLKTVICIDDDESVDNHFTGTDVNGVGMSMRSSTAAEKSGTFVDAVGDECKFTQENISPLKLSKCKRTYSGKAPAPATNRYGLSTESDSGSSDDDLPDCEFMEDSCGKLREQWEKASWKRKHDIHVDHSRFANNDHVPSKLHNDVDQSVGLDNNTGSHGEVPAFYASRKETFEIDDPPSPSMATEIGGLGSCSNDSKKNSFSDYLLKSVLNTKFPCTKVSVEGRSDSASEDDYQPENLSTFPTNYDSSTGRNYTRTRTECGTHQLYEEDDFIFVSKEQKSPESERVNRMEQEDRNEEKNSPDGPCLSKVESSGNMTSCHKQANSVGEEASAYHNQRLSDNEVGNETLVFQNKDENFQQATTQCSSNFVQGLDNENMPEEKLVTTESSFCCSQPFDKTQVFKGVTSMGNIGPNHVEILFCHCASSGKAGISHEKDLGRENMEFVPEGTSSSSRNLNEGQVKQGESCSVEFKEARVVSMSNDQQKVEMDNMVHGQESDVMHTVKNCIINEREKLKETDEYKRVMEEEWASRQLALRTQAEEAQQLRLLRKRSKAVSMRLLDMERRQKQRVEEMRETQKKDEENLNMKEELRAEIRKELQKLEITCLNMASLLHRLGIRVGDGLTPSQDEVRAAYKRALLTFHPDRASRSDLRKQVESEEKFKLISRMKEKFLLT